MIYLGADHGGFPLKEKVKEWLKEWGYEFEDMGAKTLNMEDDYPVFAFAVAEKVASSWQMKRPWKEQDKGILFCRSSGGVVVAANKVQGIRAITAWDEASAIHGRKDNNANIIALAGDWTDDEMAKKIIRAYLDTDFSTEERHSRRLLQIADYEDQHSWMAAMGGCCGGDCNHFEEK